MEATHYPIPYFDKTALQFQLHDVTEERRLEKELSLQKQQQMKTILDAQERERKNMGEELHDNINQILTAVKLNLEMALIDPEKREALISKCMNNTALIIEEIRKLSRSYILSGNIKELGLVHSVTELTKEYHLLKKIQFHINTRDFREETLNQEEKLAVYRIIQEQVNNVLKHAQASEVHIDLACTAIFTLQIRDNGNGFKMGEKPKGVGLTNIFNRAELLNGKVSIDSAPGKGCLLRFVFKPLKTIAATTETEIINPSLQI
jgi:signal transduction histidine kinase